MSMFNYKIWPLHENSMLFKLGLSQDTQLGIRFLVMLEELNFSIVWFDPDQACIYINPFCAFWACFAPSSTVRSFISFQSISRGAPLWGTWIWTLCMKKSRERKKKKAQQPVEVLWHCCLTRYHNALPEPEQTLSRTQLNWIPLYISWRALKFWPHSCQFSKFEG